MQTTVGLFLIDKENRILATHPTRHKANQWDIVKGCKDNPNEPNIITLYREFEEETGRKLFSTFYNGSIEVSLNGELVDFSDYIGKVYHYNNKNKILYTFVMFLDNNIDITAFKCNSYVKRVGGTLPQFPEIDAFAWLDIEDCWMLHDTQQNALFDINKEYNIWKQENILNFKKYSKYFYKKDNNYA